LAEFAVNIANKVAHSEFSDAINDTLQGRKVTLNSGFGDAINDVSLGKRTSVDMASFDKPQFTTDSKVNLWDQDGPNSSHYRNVMEERVNFVMDSSANQTASLSPLRSMAALH